MNPTRTRLLVALALVATIVLVVATAGGFLPGPLGPSEEPDDGDEREPADPADRPADPSTNDTIGYVDGYWYDDDLPVDDRDDAALESDELDEVVSRSMARVEAIRNLPFEDEVSVDVVSREEYQAEDDDLFADVTGDERVHQNVNYEALFMVDRDTDAADAFESLYGGAVDGYYDPATEEIVLVSDSPESPELDEPILGHELLHALQDQHFDLSSYDRETIDQDNAKNGLIEGDAVWLDEEYDQRCADEWDCLQPGTPPLEEPDLNWGLYLTIFQPYDDGPDYVDYLLDRGGWDAVDAAYDDPPASSSAVIRPGEEREPAEIEIDDRSNDEWQQLEIDGEVATESVGEAGMVSMFAAGVFELGQPSVIDRTEFVSSDMGYEFDHPQTDGWAGDELVTYVADDASADADAAGGGNETTAPDDAVDDTGYVWQTEWLSDEDAEQFADAYDTLLDQYDADPIDDHQDTYVIDEEFPGAYYLDVDGETVTIVRAPSVDELDAVESGAAPTGSDTLEFGDETETDDENDDTAEDEGSFLAGTNVNPGFGTVTVALVSVVALGTAGWFVVLRTNGSARVAAVASSAGPLEPRPTRATTR